MSHLKIVDRIAIAAMFSTIALVPLAAHACRSHDGKPDAKVTLADGSERRFYTSGPMGVTTFRVDVSAAGVRGPESQVLNDSSFGSIRAGMTASQVFELLGPPYAKARFGATRTTAWDYHYRDAWGYDADFSVIIDDSNVVAGKISVRYAG